LCRSRWGWTRLGGGQREKEKKNLDQESGDDATRRKIVQASQQWRDGAISTKGVQTIGSGLGFNGEGSRLLGLICLREVNGQKVKGFLKEPADTPLKSGIKW